jgi:hypothetical protein
MPHAVLHGHPARRSGSGRSGLTGLTVELERQLAALGCFSSSRLQSHASRLFLPFACSPALWPLGREARSYGSWHRGLDYFFGLLYWFFLTPYTWPLTPCFRRFVPKPSDAIQAPRPSRWANVLFALPSARGAVFWVQVNLLSLPQYFNARTVIANCSFAARPNHER